jgi:hypothetical protein
LLLSQRVFKLLDLLVVVLGSRSLMVAKTSDLAVAFVVELETSFYRHVSD